VFNALQALVDDRTGAGENPPQPAAGVHGLPDGEAGRDATGEADLEFDVPETEWQRFFITAADTPAAEPDVEPDAEAGDGGLAADVAPDGLDSGDASDPPPQPRSVEEETADTDTWKAFLREAETGTTDMEGDEDDDEPLVVVSEDLRIADVLVRHSVDAAGRSPDGAGEFREADRDRQFDPEPGEDAVPADGAALEITRTPAAAANDWPTMPSDSATTLDRERSEGVPPKSATVLDWEPASTFPERPPRPPPHTARWLTLSLLAALALGAQFLHYRRDALAAHPGYGDAVRALYDRLGQPLHPAWPLDAYEIRDAKAIAENSSPGALDIVAEIAVAGTQPVGPPLVRVVLRDRWSNPVASGTFDAASYLVGPPPASGVYSPGTLIPVQISLRDPGSAAQGYELDVCVPDRHLGLQCRSGRDPFRQ
jgi:hypothetical protein